MQRSLVQMSLIAAGFAALAFTSQCKADGLDAVGLIFPLISVPTGTTFIGSLGTTDASGQSSSSNSRMKAAVRDDAAFYVATRGEESRPALEQAFERYRQAYPEGDLHRLEIATAILANDPSMESLY